MSKRLGGIIGGKDKTSSWHLNGFPDGSNYGCPVPCLTHDGLCYILRIVLGVLNMQMLYNTLHIMTIFMFRIM